MPDPTDLQPPFITELALPERDIIAVQWYPGHIAKVERELDRHLALCDVVIELVDARMPLATTNPRLLARYGNKPRILVLNKADLADPAHTKRWEVALKSADAPIVLTANSTKPPTVQQLAQQVLKLGQFIQAGRAQKGLKNRSLRALVCGMPNVGKSTLINALVNKKKVATGHKAGVTRQPQWVRIHPQIELLDTPGVIPPRLDDAPDQWPTAGMLLTFVSSVGDAAYDEESMAQALLLHMDDLYPGRCRTHYAVPAELPLTLETIAQCRSWIQHGGVPDLSRTARTVLSDFRQARWGRLTLQPAPMVTTAQ